jgi:hypothetical protein
MPPSPQPDFIQRRSSFRRASSLPPETVRADPPLTSIPLQEQASLSIPNDQDTQEDTIKIEELSPEAIIPDSVTILRDPEVEIPDDEDPSELDLERKLTAIKLDRMDDVSDNKDQEMPITPIRTTRKRKFTPTEEGENDERQRKRMPTPQAFSPFRGNGWIFLPLWRLNPLLTVVSLVPLIPRWIWCRNQIAEDYRILLDQLL